jgi:hypothetical protein
MLSRLSGRPLPNKQQMRARAMYFPKANREYSAWKSGSKQRNAGSLKNKKRKGYHNGGEVRWIRPE